MYLCIFVMFLYHLCCSRGGMGQDAGRPQSNLTLLLISSWFHQGHPSYPKTRVLWLLFPPSYLNTQTLSQSPQKSQCIFFLNFAFCSLALTDGGRIQASCPKQRDDLCSISGFPCQALKLSSLSLILQRLVISVTKDRLLTNQEMTFARNSCHKSPFPRPPVHEPAEMSLRKSRNWIMSDLQEHSVF